MSMPTYEITCTNCAFSGRFAYNVDYRFEAGDGPSVKPRCCAGWCEHCQEVLTIFVPEPGGLIEYDAMCALKELERLRREETSWWKKHFWRKERQDAKRKCEATVQLYQASLDYFEKANLSKRCLTCGGVEVVEVELPERLAPPTALGITHVCGGELIAEESISLHLGGCPKVIFDPSGNIIFDERETWSINLEE